MKKYKLLSLDESGKASYNHKSELFILSGVVINESFKTKLNKSIKKIKQKYFGDEDLVFHSRDMIRKKGPFSIFKNTKNEVNFWNDLIPIIDNNNISVLFVVTDKNEAKKRNWRPETILKRS